MEMPRLELVALTAKVLLQGVKRVGKGVEHVTLMEVKLAFGIQVMVD